MSFVKFAQEKDAASFKQYFEDAIQANISAALEDEKIAIAQSMFGEEVEEEVYDDEDEVVEEGYELDEKFKLFHPGQKATVHSIDKYAFTGRDNHPPTDGSLEGHKVRIHSYGDSDKEYGISGGDEHGNPRVQSVHAEVLSGKHKGKKFEFMHHELKKPTNK